MEDLYLMEEVMMIQERVGRRRTRNDFFELPNFDFYRTTRFTKDGVRDLTARLEEHLVHQDARGCPVTPLHQVYMYIHKRVVTFYVTCSIVNNSAIWGPFGDIEVSRKL